MVQHYDTTRGRRRCGRLDWFSSGSVRRLSAAASGDKVTQTKDDHPKKRFPVSIQTVKQVSNRCIKGQSAENELRGYNQDEAQIV